MHASGAGKQWYFVLRAVCGWWFLFVAARCQAAWRTCLCQNAVLNAATGPVLGRNSAVPSSPGAGFPPGDFGLKS